MTNTMPTPPTTLIVFDPGPHTGVAVFIDGKLAQTLTIEQGEWNAQYRQIFNVFAWYRKSSPVHPVIVCEQFATVYASVSGTSSAVHTARLTGWIEGLALTMGWPFTWQQPSYRAGYLKAAQRMPHHSVHETDAIAHGLAYLAHKIHPEEE
jgi:hypothetical protein